MSDLVLSQTTQFRVKEVSITLADGKKIDITGIFNEINLFDNMFIPCMTGTIVVRDSQNLFDKIKLNGDEKVKIKIDKGDDSTSFVFGYEKIFVIYKISNRMNVNETSQIYTINLVNEDYLFSLQQRVIQNYVGAYSNAVERILVDYLRVRNSVANQGQSGIGFIEATSTIQNINMPPLTPFDAIEFISKRATSVTNDPDYVFFENKSGYNFISLSKLFSYDSVYNINLKPKNIDEQLTDEFFGAREYKVLSSFDTVENIKNGSYAGKFIGFDTITRTQVVTEIKDAFSETTTHGNKNSNLVEFVTKDGANPKTKVNSRVVTYPFTFTRPQLQYIRTNNPNMTTFIDNTHEYIFQRKAIFTNFMQKRLQLTMPGNFGFFSGVAVNVFIPKFAIKDEGAAGNDSIDKSLSGKYLIVGARHIIKYNKHETILEVATDSTQL